MMRMPGWRYDRRGLVRWCLGFLFLGGGGEGEGALFGMDGSKLLWIMMVMISEAYITVRLYCGVYTEASTFP
jgi:hypothetical protein